MDRIKTALSEVGIRFSDVGKVGGMGVWFGETDYIVLSVQALSTVGALYITSGVLKDISADRLAILDICNNLTRDNPTYPVFLDDSEDGWDVLLQQRFPIDRLLANLPIFKSYVEEFPGWARHARQRFALAGLQGQVHAWNADDVRRLVLRSVM